MNLEFLSAIIYYIVLYTALGCIVIPIFFILLWTFFDFFKKHILIFYFVLVVLYFGAIGLFYLYEKQWMYWYFDFPSIIQGIGLAVYLFGGLIVKIAQNQITFRVRFFYPLLKGGRFPLRTDGIYKYVRHPMYAVFPWIIMGALLYTEQLIIIVPFLFNIIMRSWYAKREEEHLKKIVIGDYEKYKKQTPHRFYPHFKK